MPQNTPYKYKASLGNIQLAFVALIMAAGTSSCFASGWNDFVLDIGDGYVIFKNNSYDVGVGAVKTNGRTNIILLPADYNGIGPVVAYIATDKLILTKNIAAKKRNLFPGDEFLDLDPTKEFYFIILKANNQTIGPLPQVEFNRHREVTELGTLDWKAPRNPAFFRPLIGDMLFSVLAIYILAKMYPFVSVPVLLTVIALLILLFRRKSRHQQV